MIDTQEERTYIEETQLKLRERLLFVGPNYLKLLLLLAAQRKVICHFIHGLIPIDPITHSQLQSRLGNDALSIGRLRRHLFAPCHGCCCGLLPFTPQRTVLEGVGCLVLALSPVQGTEVLQRRVDRGRVHLGHLVPRPVLVERLVLPILRLVLLTLLRKLCTRQNRQDRD